MPSRSLDARVLVLATAIAVSLFSVSSHAIRQVPSPASLHLKVPDGFVIERIAGPELLSYPMFGVQDDCGRLFLFESTEPNTMTTEEMLAKPSYHIRVLEDADGDGSYDRSTIYADKLPFPKGGAFVDGSLFVSAAPHLLRLKDTNDDLVADERETVLTGWTLNVNGAALGGPFLGPDGWLYLTDARRGFRITRKEGDTLEGKGARIWRVRPDGSGLEWIAGGGYDNAIELVFMPSGDTIGTMTYFIDPRDGVRDALMHWVEGGVYPKPHDVIATDKLPLTGDYLPPMTTLARVAPSGLVRYRGAALGAGFHGNLFSAQFNTGRVMRHIVTASGSTYRTEDLPFVTATAPDSHPTDVLQDADGSLIVIETGGWFIKGCPLSRVAKPDVAGSIYRIRKAGAPPVNDPRGLQIPFASLTPARVGGLLADARPVVRDRAIEHLVHLGEPAVAVLAAARRTASDVETRAATVFALHRIGTPSARESVRAALADRDPGVRVAAARSVGLARDAAALPVLLRAVVTDAPAVRRQTAIALEQIGQPEAVPALLKASQDPADRFVEHAVIHALTALREPAPLVTALASASHNERRAALVALDQMAGRSGQPPLPEAGTPAAVPRVQRRRALADGHLGGIAPSGLVGPDRHRRAHPPRGPGGRSGRRRRRSPMPMRPSCATSWSASARTATCRRSWRAGSAARTAPVVERDAGLPGGEDACRLGGRPAHPAGEPGRGRSCPSDAPRRHASDRVARR